MEAPSSRASVDHARLAASLAALAYPLRLAILEAVGRPVTLSEVRVSPLRVEEGGNPERPAAMPTVAAHLEKLVDEALVLTGETRHAGKTLTTYAVNPQRLYAIAEDLRRLAAAHRGRGRGGDETGTIEGAAAPRPREGPRLVVVHGVDEGRAFPLDPATAAGGAWTIGRTRDAAVSLDYDPFVSVENARVMKGGEGFVLLDVAGSKNGTSLNWAHLPRGGAAPLAHGDIVGVGRSFLVFRER